MVLVYHSTSSIYLTMLAPHGEVCPMRHVADTKHIRLVEAVELDYTPSLGTLNMETSLAPNVASFSRMSIAINLPYVCVAFTTTTVKISGRASIHYSFQNQQDWCVSIHWGDLICQKEKKWVSCITFLGRLSTQHTRSSPTSPIATPMLVGVVFELQELKYICS